MTTTTIAHALRTLQAAGVDDNTINAAFTAAASAHVQRLAFELRHDHGVSAPAANSAAANATQSVYADAWRTAGLS